MENVKQEIEAMIRETSPRDRKQINKLEKDIKDLVLRRTGLTCNVLVSSPHDSKLYVFLSQISFEVEI